MKKRTGFSLIELGMSILLSIFIYTISLYMIKEHDFKEQVKNDILTLENFIFNYVLGSNNFGWLINTSIPNCSEDTTFNNFSPKKVLLCFDIKNKIFPISQTVNTPDNDNVYHWKYEILKEYGDKKSCQVKFGYGQNKLSLYVLLDCFDMIEDHKKGIYIRNMFIKMMNRHNTVESNIELKKTINSNGAKEFNFLTNPITKEVVGNNVSFYESNKEEPIKIFTIEP